MDSLLATYASSDEEDEQQDKYVLSESSVGKTSSTSLSSSLPPPKSSSSSSSSSPFSFLPPPRLHLPNPSSQTLTQLSSSKPTTQFHKQEERQPQLQPKESLKPPSCSASTTFSLLPPPKSQTSSDPFALANLSSAPKPKPKKIIQLKLPVMKSQDSDDDDDDNEREGKRKTTESVTGTATVKSSLSSILPAPKSSSTLGSLPSAAGSGRRSILEADVTTSLNLKSYSTDNETSVNPNAQVVEGLSSASLGDEGSSAQYVVESGGGGGDTSSWVSPSSNDENYEGYAGYGNYDYYGQYESNWGDGSTTAALSDVAGTVESVVKVPGKRGRNDVPQEIIEVKQDELMKNRPREDQVKLTGLAFGPSYQPVSTKGKPSKLHKRKHQITSLYFDVKQKEMELSERRAKGFLTKAETQAKYGW